MSLLLMAQTAAWAQEPVQRPFRRVFGAGAPPVGPGQSRLMLDLTAAGVFDDNILAGRLRSADPRLGEGGSYPTAAATAAYEKHARRTTILASGSSSVQYFAAIDGRLDRTHAGNVSLDHTFSPRTTLRLVQSGAYSTYYTLLGIPGAVQPIGGVSTPLPPPVPGQSQQVAADNGTELNSLAALERQLGGGNSIDANYSYALTRFPQREFQMHGVGSTFRHGFGRRLSARAGYGLQTGQSQVQGGYLLLHNIDAGVDYSRNLPGLRNTTFSVTTGSTVFQLQRGLQYGLRANASLVHLMARSWSATGAYSRGAQFLPVLDDVLTSSAFTATLNGFASPRAELTFTGSYTTGFLGLRAEAETLTYGGTASAQIGLSRRVAIDVSYQYFLYDFAEAATIPTGLPFNESRQSLRVGLALRVPVIN